MITTRKNTFETNSSSTHAICIPKKRVSYLPTFIRFEVGEYGWEVDEPSPANYLYTAIMECYETEEERQDYLNYIEEILKKNDIICEFKPPMWNDRHTYFNDGYIDHCEELSNMLSDIRNDEDLLMRYLCGAQIYTDNDNRSDDDNYAERRYDDLCGVMDCYWKGN